MICSDRSVACGCSCQGKFVTRVSCFFSIHFWEALRVSCKECPKKFVFRRFWYYMGLFGLSYKRATPGVSSNGVLQERLILQTCPAKVSPNGLYLCHSLEIFLQHNFATFGFVHAIKASGLRERKSVTQNFKMRRKGCLHCRWQVRNFNQAQS